MEKIKNSPAVTILITSVWLFGLDVCSANMFKSSRPLPPSNEARVYGTGSLGVKIGKLVQVIETGKDGVSKVYETGSLGVKMGKPVQVIETGKDGITKVYDAGVLGLKTGKQVQVSDNKR